MGLLFHCQKESNNALLGYAPIPYTYPKIRLNSNKKTSVLFSSMNEQLLQARKMWKNILQFLKIIAGRMNTKLNYEIAMISWVST